MMNLYSLGLRNKMVYRIVEENPVINHRGFLRQYCKNRKFLGVCSGLAEFFGVDVSFIRIAFVVFSLVWGVGLIVYLISWLVIPEEK